VRTVVEHVFDGIRLRYVAVALLTLLIAALGVVAVLDQKFGTVRQSPYTVRLGVAAAVAGAGVLWVLLNQPVEGAVIVHLSKERGITVADLPALVLVAPVLYLLAPRRSAGERRGIDPARPMERRTDARRDEADE
jgi:hypothetical protein